MTRGVSWSGFAWRPLEISTRGRPMHTWRETRLARRRKMARVVEKGHQHSWIHKLIFWTIYRLWLWCECSKTCRHSSHHRMQIDGSSWGLCFSRSFTFHQLSIFYLGRWCFEHCWTCWVFDGFCEPFDYCYRLLSWRTAELAGPWEDEEEAFCIRCHGVCHVISFGAAHAENRHPVGLLTAHIRWLTFVSQAFFIIFLFIWPGPVRCLDRSNLTTPQRGWGAVSFLTTVCLFLSHSHGAFPQCFESSDPLCLTAWSSGKSTWVQVETQNLRLLMFERNWIDTVRSQLVPQLLCSPSRSSSG